MTLLILQTIDPFSENYIFPKVSSTKELTRLLLARQKKVLHETICEAQPEFTERIIQRQFKLLLKKYDIKLILRGVEQAVLVAEHPFTTKFIEEQIEYYLELKQV